MAKSRITPAERRAEIVRRVHAGESHAEIARDLGMYSETVRQIAIKGGAKTKHKPGDGSPWRNQRLMWKS